MKGRARETKRQTESEWIIKKFLEKDIPFYVWN